MSQIDRTILGDRVSAQFAIDACLHTPISSEYWRMIDESVGNDLVELRYQLVDGRRSAELLVILTDQGNAGCRVQVGTIGGKARSIVNWVGFINLVLDNF